MSWVRLRERALRDLPTPVRIGFLAMAACWVAYVVLVPALGPDWYLIRDTLLYGVVGLGATALVFARAWLGTGSDRRVWSIMGLGLVLSMIGQIVYASMVAPLDPEPFPSVADPVYLVAYVAWYVAIALLVRDPKTLEMRLDLATAFGPEEATWKAELLRCDRSQHERNLRTRGTGFDERILATNREIGREIGLEFAEGFEVMHASPTPAC